MNITIIGTGYVGLVTGACLAELGNNVFCLDLNPHKIEILNSGGVPIYEAGLKEIIERNVKAGRLTFSTDVAASVAHGSIQFIAVGTPPDEGGNSDLQYVLAAARNIGRHMHGFTVVVGTTPTRLARYRFLSRQQPRILGRRRSHRRLHAPRSHCVGRGERCSRPASAGCHAPALCAIYPQP